MKLRVIMLLCGLLGAGCTGIPQNVEPIKNFELERYLGQWHEIARLDHSFERGLEQVTAEYSMRDDGGVKVINRGYSIEEKQFEQAEGKAYFVESADVGYLKVSFFGPFYGSYVIAALDEDYRYALVVGPNTDYLWILAREPELDLAIVNTLVAKAKDFGVDTEALIFPKTLQIP
ncbi:lipocalin family protein [Echinimonas agarilytica]|uniref:Outer membrane lipoprotein Blc n=1 Tax=Echinimonas agarilytica TaxID=1215918 RepID=A0AA41W443_9GAMM|nr:lipocalin family protein [Echinimonas agarilytica]MCM2678484.1 lipocalin family protein [Echinimonas agarilytica]